MKRTEWNWWGHVAGVGSSEVEMLKEEITKRKKHKEIGVVAAEAIFDEFFLLERENDEGCEVGIGSCNIPLECCPHHSTKIWKSNLG